ncbi:hypothetical protein GGH92_009318, partial [Coemansia sp. RSA 2673]
MQLQTQVAYRQPRLASINDSTSKQQQQQIQSPSTRLAGPTATASTNTAGMSGPSSSNSGAFIPEDYLGYLIGGPCNRFALALKSNLDNEIDWACVRLVAATHQAPESWSLKIHAPFL